jgi:hypothetical protein
MATLANNVVPRMAMDWASGSTMFSSAAARTESKRQRGWVFLCFGSGNRPPTCCIGDNLLRRASAAKLLCMKRQLLAAIVMLAIGLQGSVVAFAGISPLMSTNCQTSLVSHSDASQDSCCPNGHHTMGCCLEACAGTVAGAVTMIPQALNCVGSATLLPQFLSTRFSSRGDSPLIRPPIL